MKTKILYGTFIVNTEEQNYDYCYSKSLIYPILNDSNLTKCYYCVAKLYNGTYFKAIISNLSVKDKISARKNSILYSDKIVGKLCDTKEFNSVNDFIAYVNEEYSRQKATNEQFLFQKAYMAEINKNNTIYASKNISANKNSKQFVNENKNINEQKSKNSYDEELTR